MTPSRLYHQIKTDKYFLLNSYLTDTALMSAMIAILLNFHFPFKYQISMTLYCAIFVIAIINGLIISSLLHNTSHGNIPTKILNRIVGEYCGYWVLYGFTNFSLVHISHHQFSDEELDPVNPKGMTFLIFLSAPMRYMIKRTKEYLYMVHGRENEYQRIMRSQVFVFHLNLILRLIVWYLLLGKGLFFSFYLPGFITIVCIFAHINYVCHRDHADGSVEIVNLDHNLFYRLANFFTMGGYYHKNHHLNMKVFNPKFFQTKRSMEKHISIKAKIYLNPNEKYFFSGNKIYRYLNINNVWGEGEKNRFLSQRKFHRHPANGL